MASTTESLYADAPVTVRQDLITAHADTVQAWATPGNWWSAGERLAMVMEVRRARAADELPAWVSPSSVEGLVEDSPLPEAAVDAIWRLTNHSGTLTDAWHQSIIERGFNSDASNPDPDRRYTDADRRYTDADRRYTELAYVELVSVVATANCLEVFASAIGVDSLALPAASEGHPDFASSAEAAVSTHWVPTVPGRGSNVLKSLSAVPVAEEAWNRLSDAQYVPREALLHDLTWSRGALDRSQVELLAARTSLINECFY